MSRSAEDILPLVDDLLVAPQIDTAAGAVDDARPDRWGERVIRKFEVSPRMSILSTCFLQVTTVSGLWV